MQRKLDGATLLWVEYSFDGTNIYPWPSPPLRKFAKLFLHTFQGAPPQNCAKLPVRMKLYTTPPLILTLVTWVQRTQA